MEVKNLSQLKRTIRTGKKLIIRDHIRSENIGQIRKPNIVQTNGFYMIESERPDSKITLANQMKGSWLAYGRASDWDFYKGQCFVYKCKQPHTPDNLIMAFDFID